MSIIVTNVYICGNDNKLMTPNDIENLALIYSINAEIEGMKAENQHSILKDTVCKYQYRHFKEKADRLREIHHSYWIYSSYSNNNPYYKSKGANEKLPPKEWLEKIYLGKKVGWGTNTFGDLACIELIEKYVQYLNDK